MKDKPPFESLPAAIRERLLWNMELDYCPYESSKAEAIRDIMHCTKVVGTNALIVSNYYKALSVDSLVRYLGQESDAAAKSVREMDALMVRLIHDFGTTE